MGPANVDDIARGDVRFESAEGASNLEFGEILGVLAAAVIFINNTLSIYRTIKQERSERVGVELLRAEVEGRGPEPSRVDEAKREEVYRAVVASDAGPTEGRPDAER